MEALVYCRWSTQHQEDGDSFERQTRLAEQIAEQKGWTITEVHIESGKSAYHGLNRSKSGKLRQIEDRAYRGELQGRVLIVEAMDRLSRQEPMASLTLLNNLCDNGLTICESSTGHIWDKAQIKEHWTNLIVALARAGEAYDSSRLKARRVKSAWQATQATGRTKTGKADPRLCPAWMEVVDGEYTVVEQRADIIRKMVAMSLNGHGLRPIALWANEQREAMGWPKGKWQIRTVHNMLKDRRLLGEYQPFERTTNYNREAVGEPINLYPAIVTHTQFHELSKGMEARKHTGGPRKKFVNVLTGLCRCNYVNDGVVCGSKLNMRPQKRAQPQLTCASFNRGSGCKANGTYRYSSLLNGILDNLLVLAMPMQNQPDDNQEEIVAKRGELIAKEKRADEIADRLIEQDDPIMERALHRFREQIKALNDELRELEKTVKIEITPVEDVLSEIQSLRSSMDDDVEARMRIGQLLQSVIDVIEMDYETRGCHVITKGGNVAVSFNKKGNYLGAMVLQEEIIGPDGERNWKPE